MQDQPLVCFILKFVTLWTEEAYNKGKHFKLMKEKTEDREVATTEEKMNEKESVIQKSQF